MSTINDTDLFLVQRGQDSYKQSAVDLMSTIQDTDYMVIQRGEDSYKVTCEDVKDQLGGGGVTAPVLDSVVLAQDTPIDTNRFTSKLFTSTAYNSGGDPTTLEMTGTVTGALGIKAGSDPITTNAYPGTSSTDVVLTLSGETNLGDLIQVGDTVIANVSYTPESDTISSISTSTATTYETFGSSQADANWDQPSATQYDVGTAPPSGSAATILTKAAAGAVFGIDGNFTDNTKNITISVSDDGTNWTEVGDYSQLDLNVGQGNGFVMAKFYLRAAWGVGAGTEYWYVREAKAITTLALPSEKDIALFQAGDVVQPSNIYSRYGNGETNGAYPQTKLFDGNVATNADCCLANNTNSFIWEYPEGIPFTTLEITGVGKDQIVKINDLEVQNTGDFNTWGTGAACVKITPTFTGSVGNRLTKIELPKWQDGAALAGIYIDGTLLVDGTTPEIKVTATDVSAKTITVDGGNWDVSDQSRVWSDTAWTNPSSSTNYVGKNAFDGNLDTRVGGDTSDYSVYTFNPPLVFANTVRIYGDLDTRAATNPDIKANSTSVTGVTNGIGINGANKKWYTVLSGGGTLTSVSVKSVTGTYWGFINAIEVDGKRLVDKALDSEDWSDNLYSGTTIYDGSTTTKNFQPADPATNAFDGNANTVAYENGSSSWIYFRPSSPITVTSTIEFETRNTVEIKVNGAAKSYTGGDSTWNLSKRSVDSFTGQLTEFAIRDLDNTGSSGLAALWIDGLFLIDSSARDLGDTEVSTTAAKQGSGTVSDITGAQVTVSPFTDNCFKEGQYLTVNKTIDVDPKTDKITSYDDTTKVITVAGDQDMLQFAAGDSVFMTDNSGSGASTKTGYKLTTSTIGSVSGTAPNITLTFEGNNPDLKYFKQDDVLGSDELDWPDTVTWYNVTERLGRLTFSPAQTPKDNKIWVLFNPAIFINMSETWTIKGSAGDKTFTVAASTYEGWNNPNDGTDWRWTEYTGTVTSIEAQMNTSSLASWHARGISFNGQGEENALQGLTIDPKPNYTITNTSQTFTVTTEQGVTVTQFVNRISGAGEANGPASMWNMTDDGVTQYKVVSVNPATNQMVVSGGDWLGSDGSGTPGGKTVVELQTTGGVGTIAAGGIDLTNKTITLTASEVGDARWIADNIAGTEFRVATATKPAVASTAYLKFSANGAVTGYQATPVEPRVMDNKINPKLIFPATFPDTGQAPDAEFPDPNAYIQTSVQLKNGVGDSAVVKSNQLVPATTNSYVVPSGAVVNNADEIEEQIRLLATHDQRVADNTAAKYQALAAEAQANLRRYIP